MLYKIDLRQVTLTKYKNQILANLKKLFSFNLELPTHSINWV